MNWKGSDRREWAGGEGRFGRREGRHRDPGGQQREVGPGTIERNEASLETANKPRGRRKERSPEGLMEGEVHTEDMWRTQRSGLRFLSLLSVDWIKPDSGMNPAEAAEEAPSDPDTDAFYKPGKENGCGSSAICNNKSIRIGLVLPEAPGGATGAGAGAGAGGCRGERRASLGTGGGDQLSPHEHTILTHNANTHVNLEVCVWFCVGESWCCWWSLLEELESWRSDIREAAENVRKYCPTCSFNLLSVGRGAPVCVCRGERVVCVYILFFHKNTHDVWFNGSEIRLFQGGGGGGGRERGRGCVMMETVRWILSGPDKLGRQ